MGIILEKSTNYGTGVKAAYHRITQFSVNALTGGVEVSVASYANEAAHDAGSSPFYITGYSLVVNIMEVLDGADVGKTIYDVVKELLEAGLLELPDFYGGTIA